MLPVTRKALIHPGKYKFKCLSSFGKEEGTARLVAWWKGTVLLPSLCWTARSGAEDATQRMQDRTSCSYGLLSAPDHWESRGEMSVPLNPLLPLPSTEGSILTVPAERINEAPLWSWKWKLT